VVLAQDLMTQKTNKTRRKRSRWT